MKKLVVFALVGFLLSCNKDDCSNVSDCPPSPEIILQQMESIDKQIQEMISTACSNTGQCIATPYGAKACGGPATFLIHSNNMDLAKFNALVNSYNELNEVYNRETGAISDCALVGKPELECVDGTCQVVIN